MAMVRGFFAIGTTGGMRGGRAANGCDAVR
jgi:hypothetical protein